MVHWLTVVMIRRMAVMCVGLAVFEAVTPGAETAPKVSF